MHQRGLDHASTEGDPIGKLTLIVDQNTTKRFYPFPRCEPKSLESSTADGRTSVSARSGGTGVRAGVRQMKSMDCRTDFLPSHTFCVCFSSDGFTDTGIRVDLSSRLTELLKEGYIYLGAARRESADHAGLEATDECGRVECDQLHQALVRVDRGGAESCTHNRHQHLAAILLPTQTVEAARSRTVR
jgi:hypothetical protein